jgi:hypothetical protein
MSEQRRVIHAEEDQALARRERARAQVEYKQSTTLLKIAKYEEKQADFTRRAARTRLLSAESRANKREMRIAKSDFAMADSQLKAASAKLQDMQASQAYLKAELAYRAAHERAMEARYELEKARLAAEHQIEPKGFSLDKYERQFHDRMAQATTKRIRAKEKRVAANAAHDRWLALEQAAQEIRMKNGGRAPPAAPPTRVLDKPVDESRERPVDNEEEDEHKQPPTQ